MIVNCTQDDSVSGVLGRAQTKLVCVLRPKGVHARTQAKRCAGTYSGEKVCMQLLRRKGVHAPTQAKRCAGTYSGEKVCMRVLRRSSEISTISVTKISSFNGPS
jgi:hypothetical protein